MKIIMNDGVVRECESKEEELHVLRHSAAHIMAQAIRRLFPEAIFAYGPATEKGFYYDVDLGDKKLTDEDLAAIEKEMRKIQKDAAEREKLEKDIRMKFAKAKGEYDQQKAAYEVESKELMKELDKKRKEAEEKTAGLDPALLEKYRSIKLHCTPPVAKLYSGQCMGCNMSLPQASLRKLKNDSGIIECENCGRMLIQM